MEKENKTSIENEHVCCFTGHRPERLEMPEGKVIKWLDEQVNKAIEDGYTDFISGMQRGVDIWAAEAVLNHKEKNNKIRLIAACAFKGMEKGWDRYWESKYHKILSRADEVHYIGSHPGRAAFFARDEWMVDHSNMLIGVFTGAPGGTQKTISYGRKKGIKVVVIDK